MRYLNQLNFFPIPFTSAICCLLVSTQCFQHFQLAIEMRWNVQPLVRFVLDDAFPMPRHLPQRPTAASKCAVLQPAAVSLLQPGNWLPAPQQIAVFESCLYNDLLQAPMSMLCSM